MTADLERMTRALVAADAAGDTQAATQIAQAIRAAQAPRPQGPGVGERLAMGAGDVIQGGAQLLANALPTGVVDAVNRGAAALNERFPVTARLGMTPATPQQVNEQVTARENEYQGRREAAGETGVDWARMGGNVAATLPLAVAAPAATTLGRAAMSGAALGGATSALAPIPDATEESFGTQKGRQVLTGAGVGAVAGPAAYMLGRAISPNLDPAVARLQAEGVQMTPGQILGGLPRRIEDASTSLPIIGDKIRAAQQGSVESYNRATINRALEPIGAKLPNGVNAGREAAQYAARQVSDAYEAVLPRMRFNNTMEFQTDLAGIRRLAANLPQKEADQFEAIVKNKVLAAIEPTGTMDGRSFQTLERSLNADVSSFSRSADAYQQQLGNAIRELKEIVSENMARTSAPDAAAAYRATKAAFANLATVERASGAQGAVDGVFTPAQLSGAVRMSDRSSRRADYARGEARMQDLSDAGRSVLPATMADSGTVPRSMLNAGTVGALATAALTGNLPIAPAVAGGMVYGAYTNPMQRLAQALLAGSRPASVQRIGDFVTGGGAVMAPALGAALANSP